MEERKIELQGVRIIGEGHENVNIGEYLLKNQSDIVKQAKTIYDNEGNILGYILLLVDKNVAETELVLMNTKGETNPNRIKSLEKKFEFKKDRTKVFIRFHNYSGQVYAFTVYDEKNKRCDFATVRIATIFGTYSPSYEVYDVQNTQFVLTHRMSTYSISYNKDELVWHLFNIYENRHVIQNLNFRPEIELTKTEIRLYVKVNGNKICQYVYDWEYNHILTTFVTELQTVCPGAWTGRNPLTNDIFLICQRYVLMKITCKLGECEMKGDFVLDKTNAILYDVPNQKCFKVTISLDEATEFVAVDDLAVIYNKKSKRFSVYSYGECLLENKHCRSNMSEIDISKIRYSDGYVYLPDGKKYLRTIKKFLCYIKDILLKSIIW